MTDGDNARVTPPTVADDGARPFTPPPPADGRTLGIIGFVLSFFFVLDIGGLVLCIISLRKTRHARQRNRLAVAGIVLSSIGILIGLVIVISSVVGLVDAAQTCARLGDGVHVIGNSTYTCTPTSFFVHTGG